MIKVGLTGGIASGKTFVANYLKALKIPVHESDTVVSLQYTKPKKKFISYLIKHGLKSAINNNSIDKKIIRKIIFKNKTKKEKVENFLHKIVEEDRAVFLKNNIKKKIVFFDIPLLFEKKLESICDFVCCAYAGLKIRKLRALNRSGMNKTIFKQIIQSQTSDKIRKNKSDYLIKTSGKKTKTYLEIDDMIYDLLMKNK